MKIDGNKKYGQDSSQQVEIDTKYPASSSLTLVLSPNPELRTPNFSSHSSLLSPLNSALSPNAELRTPNLPPQPSSFDLRPLFTDVCVGLLTQGQGVRFKANGWSMQPTIGDGEMINVEPVLPSKVRHGDIILYRSPSGITAHRVIHVERKMDSTLSLRSESLDPRHSPLVFYTRGDSLKGVDPPVISDQILGKVFSIERNGRTISFCGTRSFLLQEMHLFLYQLKQYVTYVVGGIKALLSWSKVSFKLTTANSK